MDWFTVDKRGLAAQLERKGKAFAVFELIQNAWDTDTPRVDVTLEPIAGEAYATLTVEDYSAAGFIDLDDAFTMFAPSKSAASPNKRGRFALGEKLVLALCREATISSTSGSVQFTAQGRRRTNAATETGTRFCGQIRMTRDELAEVEAAVERLIPHRPTTFNGRALPTPTMIASVACKLPTELPDADGVLRRAMRETTVCIYPGDGTGAGGEVLEMGLPVVECELGGYRVDVMQKIPLNIDRDNVPPSFARALRVIVLNAMAEHLDGEAAAASWVSEAIGDGRVTPAAFTAVTKARFGTRAVVASPSDPIANAQAEAAGYVVVHGGAMSGDAWANARKFAALPSAGAVFPSPTAQQVAQAREAAASEAEQLVGVFASQLWRSLPYDNHPEATNPAAVDVLNAVRRALELTGCKLVK